MSSSSAAIGLLAAACGILVTLPNASCDEFTDESRPYEFGFNIEGQQHRHEQKDSSGIIKGEFGFITADGIYHVTVYATDENGDFKILSMKNVRVSPPLDGSAPYSPSLQGNFGSAQRISSQGHEDAENPSTVVQQVTPTVKVFTGCSGCKVPVTDYPQAVGNYSEVQPPKPSDPSNSYTTHRSTVTQYYNSNTSPRTKPQTNSGFEVTGVKEVGSVKTSNGQSPLNANNQTQSFPRTGTVPSVDKFTYVTQIPGIITTISPQKSVDKQDFQPSTTSPFTNSQYPTLVPSTASSDRGQQHKPAQNIPINEQNFPQLTPTSEILQNNYLTPTIKTSSFPKTESVSNLINNANIPPINQQQNNLFPQLDNTPVGIEESGLPPGITEDDIKAILYKFNYTVGFHGHYESGYKNGDKMGGYFSNGRDGFGRNVQYIANEFGYQPNITLINLGIESIETPKEETEKQFGLKGYEFKWFYRR